MTASLAKSKPANGRKPTVAALAAAKNLPADFLRGLGLRDSPRGVIIPYYDAAGNGILERCRQTITAAGTKQPAGISVRAYGAEALEQARKVGHLYLVEGESDTWTFRYHRLPVLGIPGAGNAKVIEAEHIESIETLYVVVEPDKGGETFLAGVLKRLSALGYTGKVFGIKMPSGIKDPSALHIDDPAQFVERFQACVKAAVPIGLPLKASCATTATTSEQPTGLATVCLADVQPEPIRWEVPGRIPRGKLVLLAGEGGEGKSSLMISLAASITTGKPAFGLEYEALPPGDVLLISCEDDAGDTEVPRLLASGADLKRVHKVEGVQTKDGKRSSFCLAHYRQLEEELERRPDVRLVVIDPAGAYVGAAGVDDHKDSDLRSLLNPLAELAARRCVTIVMIKHFSKGATAKAVHKVGGSVGYVNTVRAAFAVAPADNDDGDHYLMPLKFNLGPKPPALVYRLQALTPDLGEAILVPFTHLEPDDRQRLRDQLFRVDWCGEADVDVNNVLAAREMAERSTKVQQCATWLESLLAQWAYPRDEIFAAAQREGYTEDNCRRAKAKSTKVKHKCMGFRGNWWWGMGDPAKWEKRPETAQSTQSPHPPHSQQSPHTGRLRFHSAESVESVQGGEGMPVSPQTDVEEGDA